MTFRTPTKATSILGLSAMLLLATTLVAQQLGTLGNAESSQVPKAVCEMIEAQHILQRPVDDAVSEQLVREFVKFFDPQKLYFLKDDIARFEKSRHDLDDLLKANNVEFATIEKVADPVKAAK